MKNLEIWKAIEDRSVPLDTYQKALIRQGYYQTSVKESLEQQMAALSAELELNLRKALQYTFEHPDQDVLSELSEFYDLNNPQHKLLAGSMLLCHGDMAAGSDHWAELVLSSDAEEAQIIEGTSEILAIQKSAVNRESAELTIEEKSFLNDVKNSDPCYLGPLAQSILEIFGGENHQDLDDLCTLEQSQKSLKTKSARFTDVRVYPNPINTDYATLSLSEPLSVSLLAEIWSVDGKLIQTIQLNPGQKDIAIWTSELEKGVYIIRIDYQDSPVALSIVKI